MEHSCVSGADFRRHRRESDEMNAFFTEEEKQNIFRRSCWMQEQPGAECRLPDESLFMEWLDRICAAADAPRSEDAEYLFGSRDELGAVHIFVLPFVKGLVQSVHVPENGRMLRPGAFREWPGAFAQSLRGLFILCADQSLCRVAGEMTLPTDAWIRERVMPVMKDGSYLRALAEDWPIAFRQMVEFTARQAAHVQELADAVCQELPAVWKSLGEEGEAPAVETVEASAADRHRGGRCVHLLKLSDGRRLVYKPHSMAIDRAFGGWLNAMTEQAGIRPFRTVSSADTSRGGFCIFEEAIPLQSLSEAAVFYERMGFLLGLVYLLRGMDLHAENIVACGTDPVIIDMETMLMPPGCLFRRWTGEEAPYSINQMSVLPMLMALPGLRESGYACLLDVQPGTHNLPVLDGRPISGADYAKELGDGFKLAIRTVLQNRVRAGQELVRRFTDCRVRMVMRPTAVYCRLLSVLSNRNVQQDVKSYRHLIERATQYVRKLEESECRRLESTEQEALDRLDVPYFEDQITEEMLRDLAGEWETVPSDIGEREAERLAFCMRRIRPEHDGVQQVPCEQESGVSGQAIRERLHEQARSVCRLLGLRMTPLAVPRGENAAYTAGFGVLLGEHCLLDGNFGAVVALCAYLTVCPEDEEIRRAVKETAEKLTDPRRTGAALTAAEPGLADGAAGFLLGSCMCREMGFLTEENFRTILSNLKPLAEDHERIRYGTEDFLYGIYGMRYAIDRIPEGACTPQLRELEEQLREMMRENPAYSGLQERTALQRAVQSELVKPSCRDGNESEGRSVNDTLRFGNAGRLYRITERLADASGEEAVSLRESGRELAWELSGAAHVLRDVRFPQDFLETGLLHGLPGVLYSVCRFLNPEGVPAL